MVLRERLAIEPHLAGLYVLDHHPPVPDMRHHLDAVIRARPVWRLGRRRIGGASGDLRRVRPCVEDDLLRGDRVLALTGTIVEASEATGFGVASLRDDLPIQEV